MYIYFSFCFKCGGRGLVKTHSPEHVISKSRRLRPIRLVLTRSSSPKERVHNHVLCWAFSRGYCPGIARRMTRRHVNAHHRTCRKLVPMTSPSQINACRACIPRDLNVRYI